MKGRKGKLPKPKIKAPTDRKRRVSVMLWVMTLVLLVQNERKTGLLDDQTLRMWRSRDWSKGSRIKKGAGSYGRSKVLVSLLTLRETAKKSMASQLDR